MAAHKHNRWILLFVLVICPLFMNFDGCSPRVTTTGNPPPPGGFSVQILDQSNNGNTAVHSGGTIAGTWSNDPTDSTTTVGSTLTFPVSAQPVTVTGGRAPADWFGTWDPVDDACLDRITFPNGAPWTGTVSLHQANTVAICSKPSLSGSFALSDSLPSTLAVTGSGFTTATGPPVLNVFDASLNPINQLLASSVSSDGTTATFVFPTNSDGTPLSAGHYSYDLVNGALGSAGVGMLSLGTNDTSKASPFGVDAVDISDVYTQCPV